MTLADGYPIDLPRLLETRLLVQAMSGAGKSWLLRRIIEQTAGQVQQIIIDPEGEFATLREKFDMVVAAAHDGDAVASPKTAKLLARRLMEHQASAVIDIYDLKKDDRARFVDLFLSELVNLPRKLWHPCMVVIDEAHVFAPEKGSNEAKSSVIDIATRGRKRGLCLVAATQRLSKLHKDVAAELGNKMIGRTTLDVDVRRAADELGMTPKEAALELRNLDDGEWHTYGPALAPRGLLKLKAGPVQTTHPKVGERFLTKPPAPSQKLRSVLAKLEDLAEESDKELRTVADLRNALADAQRRTRSAERLAKKAGVPEAEVERRIRAAVREAAASVKVETVAQDMSSAIRDLTTASKAIGSALSKMDTPAPIPMARAARTVRRVKPSAVSATDEITKPMQRVLNALATYEALGVDNPTRNALAPVAGYTVNGHFNNTVGSLLSRGLVSYPQPGTVALTDQGRPLATPRSDGDLLSMWMEILSDPQQKVLRVLYENYPTAIDRESLASATGYTVNGHFNNTVGKLKTYGAAEYPGPGLVRCSDILFTPAN